MLMVLACSWYRLMYEAMLMARTAAELNCRLNCNLQGLHRAHETLWFRACVTPPLKRQWQLGLH